MRNKTKNSDIFLWIYSFCVKGKPKENKINKHYRYTHVQANCEYVESPW